MSFNDTCDRNINIIGNKTLRTQPITLDIHQRSKSIKHQKTVLYQFEYYYWLDYNVQRKFYDGDLWMG